MTAEKTIFRAAIIGTGRIGNAYDDEVGRFEPPTYYRGENRHAGLYTVWPINHADAYRTTPGFELVAASNRSTEKLKAFGERRGIKALYTDTVKMLREVKPDIVSVCTQSPEKAEVTIAAAEAGVKAIIVEKALATSMAEADAMLAACQRHGVFLAINHPWRFSPIARQTRRLLDEGAIGALGVVSAFASSGMMHIGTHTFDLMRYWGGDVAEVDARVANYEPEKDIAASGVLHYTSGAIGFFDHIHRTAPGYEARGTEGYISMSSMVGDGWLFKTEPTFPADAKRKFPMRLTGQTLEGDPHAISPTQRLLRDVYQSLTTGAPFISTGSDGAAALEIGLACYASHLAGGPVKLPLADRSLRVPNR